MQMHMRQLLIGSALALTVVGCQRADDGGAHDSAQGANQPPTSGVVGTTAAPTTADAGHDAAAGHDVAAGGDTAASHDGQTLLVIMRGLNADMLAFTQALLVEDSAQMVARAGAMANHAHMLPSEIERIHATLGAEMAAFEAADERVHHDAERLHELALTGDADAVVRQLGEVQQGCVACHSQFRERLRTNQP